MAEYMDKENADAAAWRRRFEEDEMRLFQLTRPHSTIESKKRLDDRLIDDADDDGDTYLHRLILNGEDNDDSNMKRLRRVLARLPPNSKTINHRNVLNQTPLYLAVVKGRNKAVYELMKTNQCVYDSARPGENILHVATRLKHLRCLVPIMVHLRNHDRDTLKILVNEKDDSGMTCYHKSYEVNFISPNVGDNREKNLRIFEVFANFLVRSLGNPNIGDAKSGKTVLHYAAENGNDEAVMILVGLRDMLRRKVLDMDCVTYRKQTPVMLALGNGHDKTAKLLIHYGASRSPTRRVDSDHADDSD